MTLITPEQRELYHTKGYMILPGVIPPDMLTMLREECSYFLGYKDSQMDTKGITVDEPADAGLYVQSDDGGNRPSRTRSERIFVQ